MRPPLRLFALAVGLALCGVPVHAQAPDADAAAGQPWWKLFQIRKAFDGGSNEEEPGNVGLVSPGADSATYWLVDGGIRLVPLEMHLGAEGPTAHPPLLIWFPSVEWHHMSAEPQLQQEATNQAGGGVNAELWFGDPDSTRLKAYLLGRAEVTRDLLNDVTTPSVALFAGLIQRPPTGSQGGFRPGYPIVHANAKRGQYFPYVGVEYLDQLAITAADEVVAPRFTGSVLTLKVDFEAMPFNREISDRKIRFVVSGQYAFRRLFQTVDTLDSRQLHFLNLSLAYYFADEQRIGVALTFDAGRSPTTNFIAQRRTALVLKAKI